MPDETPVLDLKKYLSVGETIAFERASGVKFSQLDRSNGSDIATVAAFVWVVRKRKQPDLTFEQVCNWDLEMLETAAAELQKELPSEEGEAGPTNGKS